jgi:hypothetical protein
MVSLKGIFGRLQFEVPMINKMIEILNTLKTENANPEEVVKKIRETLPPPLMAFIQAEGTTAESLIAQLEPLAANALGKDTAALLKSEATLKLVGQVLVILKTEPEKS